jgi:hypothetical protein
MRRINELSVPYGLTKSDFKQMNELAERQTIAPKPVKKLIKNVRPMTTKAILPKTKNVFEAVTEPIEPSQKQKETV